MDCPIRAFSATQTVAPPERKIALNCNGSGQKLREVSSH
jgi:hypothetical protein